EYVCQPQMLVRTQIIKKKSFAWKAASIKHAYLTPPSIPNLAKTIDWCSRNDLTSISEENRAFAKKRHGLTQIRESWQSVLTPS
ncbi:MAG: hypothetical protein HN467_01880, partial [Opitutae bacterium]|nr:hypothetical protein [Opitutae bacterium]